MAEVPYNEVHCIKCGKVCHAITEAYLEARMCPKCFHEQPEPQDHGTA